MAKRSRPVSNEVGYGESGRAILEAVTDVLAASGPSAVMVGEICQEIGVAPSLVNYHFGGRERLLAAAVVHAFESLVAEMNRITYATTTSAEDQLRHRIRYRLEWTASHPGIDSMINYSHIIDPVGKVMQGELDTRIGQSTISDMVGLHTSVYGMYTDQVLDRPVTSDESDQYPELFEITGYVALSALGLATWMTGRHPANRSVADEQPETTTHLAHTFVERLLRNVRHELDDLRARRADGRSVTL
ncbi:MAG: helix-turn-helix domain containing protein [Actinomycetota bacterium]|nr:helix-turn-helix domain containing protein [Actinomycetota bacterium]MDA2972792.1 helix-turn-helix domain containing protein [Actinomycetota bacterium]MDA3002172.1 helix-turn-helix domain containing protein [Actinomycetota bacterium]